MNATATRIHPEIETDGVSTIELCARAGITYRQADVWVRTCRLFAVGGAHPGNGHQRTFTEAEVHVATIGKRLLDVGFSATEALALARRVIEEPHQPIALADGLVVINTEVTA